MSQVLENMLLIQISLEEKFEGTKEVIIIRKSNDRQYNGQMEKEKNDSQNIIQKIKHEHH